MTLLLDTSVLVEVLRLRQNRTQVLRRLVQDGHTLAISATSVAELFAGMRPSEEGDTSTLLSALHCYPVTFAIARRAGTLRYAQARQGRTFGFADMLVAATALEHDVLLATENRKDFTIPGLQLYEF